MNPRIGGLFKLSAIGFALLITMTAYWQIWAASGLAARKDNARLVYRQLEIKRGLIYAANGHTVLATNVLRHKNGLNIYLRRYPLGPLFGHPVGYNTVGSGLGQSFQVFDNGASVIPAAQTDGIYAVWADETGLAGAAGLLLIYLLFAYRGFKIASLADDGFSKLLATGLTFAVTLQAFLIVGGVTRLIPLTGITLPFMSYGGSSILANFMLLALLLMVSAKTRRSRT